MKPHLQLISLAVLFATGCCLPVGEDVRVRVKNVGDLPWIGSWTGSESIYNSPTIGPLKPGETSRWRHYNSEDIAYYGRVKIRAKMPDGKAPQVEWSDKTVLTAGDYEIQCAISPPTGERVNANGVKLTPKPNLRCTRVVVEDSKRAKRHKARAEKKVKRAEKKADKKAKRAERKKKRAEERAKKRQEKK